MQLGKPKPKIMEATIHGFTGAKSSDVLLGPTPGVDVSVLRIAKHRVMIISCDPLSFIPSIGAEASARMSAFEVASDVATSGIPPKYAIVDLNLPPHLSDGALTKYWRAFHDACLELGLSVVGGHTGRFEGCDYSVIGGATFWAFCRENEYVTSQMIEDGDDIIVTKSAGYGATSVLTRAFPRTVGKILGQTLFRKAWKYFDTSNIVRDAAVAVRPGIHDRGVTGMHDATEGGIVAALLEMASASGLGGTVSMDQIPTSEETQLVCKFFRIDPLVSLGEGSLVLACKPDRSKVVINSLRSEGIAATLVGQFSSKSTKLLGTDKKGHKALHYPAMDPYWPAYWRAVRRHLT